MLIRDAVDVGAIFTASVAAAATGPFAGVFEEAEPMRFVGFLSIFALFGALARLLAEWRIDYTVRKFVGVVLSSVFVADVVALLLWDIFSQRPTFLMGIAAAVSWMGGRALDVLAPIARTAVARQLGLPNGEEKRP